MDIISYLLGKQSSGGSANLQTKSVTITENGTTSVTPDTGYDGLSSVSVTTSVPTSVSVKPKDVNFYDYDGTLTNSYTKNEFLALNSLPDNPTHEGLTSQGWNWSLSDAKEYLNTNDYLDIGQQYITDDGSTRIYIELQDGRLNPYLSLGINGTVTIDWGDNTSDTLSGTNINNRQTTQHSYSNKGSYVIRLIPSENTQIAISGSATYQSSLIWGGNTRTANSLNRVYQASVQKIEIGSNVMLSYYAFTNCISLRTITIPQDISTTAVGAYCFSKCYSLKNIVVPVGVTALSEYCLNECNSLLHIVLPNTTISMGSYCMNANRSLKKIIIPRVNSDTNDNILSSCVALTNVVLPETITTIVNGCLYTCAALQKIKIPNTVTTISTRAFQYCSSLSNIVIPPSVMSIGSNAFGNCYSVACYDFSSHTSIPTLSSTNVFDGISSDCKIIVPDELYEDWIAATNWTNYASYIVKASEATI